MNKFVKVLLVSPYSAKIAGGIVTWSKSMLDYGKSCDDCDLHFMNTMQGLPKRWSLNHRVAYWIVGFIDSFLIIVRLFWRMLVTKPDVVHYTSSAASALYKDSAAVWVVKKIFKKKYVIHWHFGRIPCLFEERGKKYNLFRKVCKNADVSIVIDAKSYYTLKNENICSVYIPNPIPVILQHEAVKISPQSQLENRNVGDVLFVGHVRKCKGVIELVKACLECEEVKRLTIVGPFIEENIESELKNIAVKREDGKRLQMVGEKTSEEVWNYYRQCGLFCLPSYSEGFPYVILEAMAFACPIVATKVGAIPEMLSDCCCDLVDAHEVEPLKTAISKVLRNPGFAAEMGEKAHAKVLGNYSIENVFSQYLEVWS